MRIILSILLFAIASQAAPKLPDWAVPEAPVRIFTSPCHTLVPGICLPVPEQYQHLRGAQAMDRKGNKLPTTAVVIDGKLQAVEVHLPINPEPDRS